MAGAIGEKTLLRKEFFNTSVNFHFYVFEFFHSHKNDFRFLLLNQGNPPDIEIQHISEISHVHLCCLYDGYSYE
jgi:hypothetical protein